MALKEVTMYTIVCDRCGADANEDADFAAWTDPGHALDIAINSDWVEFGGNHYCERCGAPPCSCGHLYGEHDYEIGGPCESCDCAGFLAVAGTLANLDHVGIEPTFSTHTEV